MDTKLREDRGYPFHLLADYFCDYHKITEDTPYEIIEMDAIKLFTADRIDLAAKYLYIESLETKKNIDSTRELYIRHIEAFTDGTVTEAGNQNKNSVQNYLETFDHLIEEIKEKGFDSSESLIPVGGRNELFDGAHRTACAAYFGKKVTVVRFPHLSVSYDYHFFRKRLLLESDLEQMAKAFIRIREDIRCICVWPSAYSKKNLEEVRDSFHKAKIPIVYSNKRKVSYQEFRKLLICIYQEESWVGNKLNHYYGIAKKAKPCFGKGDTVMYYLVQCDNIEELIQWKEIWRKAFALEKHSIHSTDTKDQTLNIAEALFNRENRMPRSKNLIMKIGRKLRYFYAVMIRKIKIWIGKPV